MAFHTVIDLAYVYIMRNVDLGACFVTALFLLSFSITYLPPVLPMG